MKTKAIQIEDSLITTVANSFNHTEESLNEDVNKLKDWMRTQSHLPEIMDDKSLQNFLFLNKCNLEQTKRKVDMYYTMRSKMADIFEHVNPKLPNMKAVMDAIYMVPLPKLTKEMYRVFVFKIRNIELVDGLDTLDLERSAVNLQELRLKKDILIGDVIIVDCQNWNTKLLAKMVAPIAIWKGWKIYEVFSARLKAIYVINCLPFILKFLPIVKPVLKPKVFDRISICESAEILLEKLPEEMLPKDYGGGEKSLEELQELVKMDFLENQELFDRLDQLRVDESLRLEILQNSEDFGFYGNFKKLNVD